jgi:hypothetical protein
MSRSAAWTPSRRAPDIELYDRGCDLVAAASAIRQGVTDTDALPAFPALLGCLEAALRELGDAAASLQQTSGEPRQTPADPKAQAVADRLHRGYTNLRVAVRDAEAASCAARMLAARAAAGRSSLTNSDVA